MSIRNILQVVYRVCSTGIMGRPIVPSVTIKVVIGTVPGTSAVKRRSKACNWSKDRRRGRRLARVNHAFNDLAANTSSLPINQTSSFRMTNQPVVDVALDQDLSAKFFSTARSSWRCSLFHSREALLRWRRPLPVLLANSVLE